MRWSAACRFGLFLIVVPLLAGLVAPVTAQEDVPVLQETITLTRWEYLDLAYRSMTCGMRCGGEPALLYCESHILRTEDGGIAEFIFWWKSSDLADGALREKLSLVNARLPVIFRDSLPVRQGLWPEGPLEGRLLILHVDGETGEILGMFCGNAGGFSPAGIAAVQEEIAARGAIPVH
jgi:hypothetical protein